MIVQSYWSTGCFRKNIDRNLDCVFPFVAGFVGRTTRCPEKAPDAVVYSMCSALLGLVMSRKKFTALKATELTSTMDKVAELNISVAESFRDHCGNEIFTQRSGLLDHRTGNIQRFVGMEPLDAPAFERYDVQGKRVYRPPHRSVYLAVQLRW